MIEVVTLIDAPVTDRKYLCCVMSDLMSLFFHWISFQDLNRLRTNILCTVDDDSSKTYDDLNKK